MPKIEDNHARLIFGLLAGCRPGWSGRLCSVCVFEGACCHRAALPPFALCAGAWSDLRAIVGASYPPPLVPLPHLARSNLGLRRVNERYLGKSTDLRLRDNPFAGVPGTKRPAPSRNWKRVNVGTKYFRVPGSPPNSPLGWALITRFPSARGKGAPPRSVQSLDRQSLYDRSLYLFQPGEVAGANDCFPRL